MLLKPSYTTQESEKQEDPGMEDGQVVGNHVQESRKPMRRVERNGTKDNDKDKTMMDNGNDE